MLSIIAAKTRWVILVSLAFCFLYAFPLPMVGNSAYIALVILTLAVFTSNGTFRNFIGLFKESIVVKLIVFYLLIISVSLFLSVVNNSFDFSILKTQINNLASLIGCVAIVSLLYTWNKDKNSADLLSWLLIVQVLIIFLMLLSADIREVVHSLIRNDAELERMATYNNVRGMGISGSVAFGLALTMGALGFFLHFWFAANCTKMSSWKAFVIFSICLLASLSAGRTAILGFFLGFFLHLPMASLNAIVVRSFKQFSVAVVFVSLLAIYIYNNEQLRELAFLYSRYVFKFIWNYLETGSFSVTSLENLENMYFLPPENKWLLGYGKYTNIDGTYFMHTDAGYMRFFLYFGMLGSFVIYLLFVYFCLMSYQRVKFVMPMAGSVFSIFILMSFIFHYKGEVIFYSVPYMKILVIFVLYYVLEARNLGDNKISQDSTSIKRNYEVITTR